MDVRIERSERRTRTVSAREVDGYLLVRAPACMSDAELQPIIEKLRLRVQQRRVQRALDDGVLQRRAQELNRQYFKGQLQWHSISWVTDQNSRWGSCTRENATIRLSHRLADLPVFVRDYVLMHELAHLIEPNHGPGFWKLVNHYPRTERARGYLMALAGERQEGDM